MTREEYIAQFVGKRIVFDVGWFDYYLGTIKSVEPAGDKCTNEVRFVVDKVSKHYADRTVEVTHTPTVFLTHYLNYHCQRFGMWALADSKAGRDLVQRIERTWGKKSPDKYSKNPYDLELLTEPNKKFYDILVERKASGLPVYIRTKYRGDSTEYRLEKVEAKDYNLVVFRGKAFITSPVEYACKVKVTNFNKKYFFDEVQL